MSTLWPLDIVTLVMIQTLQCFKRNHHSGITRRIKYACCLSQQLFWNSVVCYGTSKRLLLDFLANDPETFHILLKIVLNLTLGILTCIECVKKKVDLLKEEEAKRKSNIRNQSTSH